jgi:hypothetical protein
LRTRPEFPNKNRGRLQVAVRRAFLVSPLPSTSEVYDRAYARHRAAGKRLGGNERWSVLRVLRAIAVPIRKLPPHGAWLWRLKSPSEPSR